MIAHLNPLPIDRIHPIHHPPEEERVSRASKHPRDSIQAFTLVSAKSGSECQRISRSSCPLDATALSDSVQSGCEVACAPSGC